MSLRTRSSSCCGFGSLAVFPSCIQAERATLGPFCNRLKARYGGTGVFLEIRDFARFLRDFRGCERFLCKLMRVYVDHGRAWRRRPKVSDDIAVHIEHDTAPSVRRAPAAQVDITLIGHGVDGAPRLKFLSAKGVLASMRAPTRMSFITSSGKTM